MLYSFDLQHYAADHLDNADALPACETYFSSNPGQTEMQQHHDSYSGVDLNEQNSGTDEWADRPLHVNDWSSQPYEMYANPPDYFSMAAIGNETDAPYPSLVTGEQIWDEQIWYEAVRSPESGWPQIELACAYGSIASVTATCPREVAIGSWPGGAYQNDESHRDKNDMEGDSNSGSNGANAKCSDDDSSDDSSDDNDDGCNDDGSKDNDAESYGKSKDRTHHASRSAASRGRSQDSELQKLCAVIDSTGLATASISIDTIGQLLPRLNVCRTCNARFDRREHLQRHIRTVHEKKERFECKVGSCKRKFPRTDNLRAHYWTHVESHGRRGTNEKMSLERLAAVIGRKERRTIRRFEERLRSQQSRESVTFV